MVRGELAHERDSGAQDFAKLKSQFRVRDFDTSVFFPSPNFPLIPTPLRSGHLINESAKRRSEPRVSQQKVRAQRPHNTLFPRSSLLPWPPPCMLHCKV
jgi:hypothetical protein